MLFSFALQANSTATTPKEKCRQLATIEGAGLAEAVKLDLLNGFWTEILTTGAVETSKSLNRVIYQFNENGLVDMIREREGCETTIQTNRWTVASYGSQSFLFIDKPNASGQVMYQLEQTCEGVTLTNTSSAIKVKLGFKPKKKAEMLSQVRSTLMGNWKSITYPFDLTKDLNTCGTFEPMQDAYLSYRFAPDGSYVRTMGTSKLEIKEYGYWELSDDGNYIVFHVCASKNPESAVRTYLAEIAHLNTGEMVMKQALHGAGDFESLFCTQAKTFFLNRA